MNALWSYFWPCFAAGLVTGSIAGTFAFRRRGMRNAALASGLVGALVAVALWHGPAGAAARFTARVERNVQRTLAYYEMSQVSGSLHRAPVTRQLLLQGRADDFQRSEIVRYMEQIPGIASASWGTADWRPPLLAEGVAIGVLGFLLGLLLAYLVELRRRYNAQWNW